MIQWKSIFKVKYEATSLKMSSSLDLAISKPCSIRLRLHQKKKGIINGCEANILGFKTGMIIDQ
jgi:hypothetical protein